MAKDNPNNLAFNAMQEATLGSPERMLKRGGLFIESEYNTRSTQAERLAYDKSAYEILLKLYKEDKDIKDRFDKLTFTQYLGAIDDEYLKEKFLYSRKDDPAYYFEGGRLLEDIFEDDPEQLKLSAYNFYQSQSEETPRRSRANVSIEAPEAEKY